MTVETALPRTAEAVSTAHRARVRDRRVLVIYGRDESNCLVLCEFLEALALHPVTFRDLADRDDEVSAEKVKRIFGSVQATVVLLTPDDDARMGRHLGFGLADVEHRRVRAQARANVYIEAGMALGQMATRTTVIDLGVATAADSEIWDVVRAGPGLDWQEDLIERLALSGCPVPRHRRRSDHATSQPFRFPDSGDIHQLAFDDVEWALENVIEQARAWRTPDCIVGLNRGGAIVAGMLAEFFQLESVGYLHSRGAAARPRFEWQGDPPPDLDTKNATLVVDDVLRHSELMVAARQFILERVRSQVRTATLASSCVVKPARKPNERPVLDFLGLPRVDEGPMRMPWESAGPPRRR